MAELVVFGATGFTGQFVVEELCRATLLSGKSHTMAVAGRNEAKLKAVLANVAKRLSDDRVLSIATIIADVADPDSITAMCSQAKMVLNCVGPYRFYGEVVVKACVEAGTHYVDITGEPEFMERMEYLYNEKAKATGSVVVSSCGFDSIPADVGCEYCVAQFPERELVSSVESYLSFNYPRSISVNYATYESAVHGFANQGNLAKVRKELRTAQIQQGQGARLPILGPALRSRNGIAFNKVVQKWTLPFHGSDASVVRRTQRHLHYGLGLAPVQFGAYLGIAYWRNAFLAALFGGVFAWLANREWGRSLLLAHPAIFTLGLVRKDSTPNEEDIRDTSTDMRFVGYGYSTKETAQSGIAPDLCIVTRMLGPECGYVLTPIVLVAAALVIVEEKEQLCVASGVMTPAVALRGTTFMQRIAERGVCFDVVHKGAPL